MKKRRLSTREINKIRFMRSQGYSLPEISKKMKIPKTTVFRYIQGVEILPEFLTVWAGKRGGSKKKKLVAETKAFEEGKRLVKTLSQREKLLFIAALYWAEGSKGDFSLSNTDPSLIKVFMQGLKDVFGIEKDRFRVSVRIYEDLDKEKCLTFWSSVTSIPKEQFVNVNILQGKKTGKLEYGMCRIRIIKGGEILKKIIGINKVVFLRMSL